MLSFKPLIDSIKIFTFLKYDIKNHHYQDLQEIDDQKVIS